MSKPTPIHYSNFLGGIGDFARSSSLPNFLAFSQSIDIRSDPNQITVLPRTIKESGGTVTDLVLWAEQYTPSVLLYEYGNSGNIYSRTSTRSYSLLHNVANSHGNGLVYSAEDGYLYYASDMLIGRYGPLSSSSPTFVDDYFGSQGGVPLNTNSLDLEASSSQYASRADTVSLSIISDIAFDVQIKPESFPTAGNQMVLVSKWDESGTLRSYKFDINTASGYFGDGSDGALTISSNTTEAPIDSAATGTTGAGTLSATNVSFATGQVIFIHQTQGTNAGSWQRNIIQGYTAGTITLDTVLNTNYISGAQVRVLKQYTNVTINGGFTYTAKAWNGTVGGILAFIANGTVTVTGNLLATGKGFRANTNAASAQATGKQGEGTVGAGSASTAANGNAGGGGSVGNVNDGASGAGGSNGIAGTKGTNYNAGVGGTAGSISGSADLTTITFGGAGGNGGNSEFQNTTTAGYGGGIICIIGVTVTVSGTIVSNGTAGQNGATSNQPGHGGGAGGSILIKAQIATLGTALLTATGAVGGTGNDGRPTGGTGGDGRIHLDYYTSFTGTTTPALNATQDNTLVTNTSQQLRLSISSTGLNSETLAFTTNLALATWQEAGVSWKASTSTASFFLNGVLLGTRVGTLTAIHDNASTFQVGMSKSGAAAAEKFYDGLIDEVRLFNTERTEAQMLSGLSTQIPTNTIGLQAYYKFNGAYTDATANANTLTATNAPVFTTDVPFSSPTTRLDIDQTRTGGASTYAVPTTISEAATERLTFTPTKDPQKSIQFNIGNIGTGTWTVTIHDSNNNVMATSTVTNANMHTGNFEFMYASVWSPLTNFTNAYHAHITCASGSPTIVSSTLNNLETGDYTTFYQFLVEDTQWHPMQQFLNFWVVGNGRYLAKYEAPLYEPNKIVLGAGWRVRCLADWQEYKAIGVVKVGEIQNSDKGRIYFWDGYSSTFNKFITCPEGGINAMLEARGKLYVWAGYQNQLYVYEGGDSLRKLRDMPYMEKNLVSEIYPGAVTMWQSYIRYGAGVGTSEEVRKGVYTYGSTNVAYPDILTYDYPPSTQTYSGSSVSIGMTTVVNGELLMSWQVGTGYGVDYVAADNEPFLFASLFLPIDDDNNVTHEKESLETIVLTSPLRTGESVILGYAYDDSYTYNFENIVQNQDATAVGDTISRMLITNGRYYESQVTLRITSNTTSPVIKGITFVKNPLITEGRY